MATAAGVLEDYDFSTLSMPATPELTNEAGSARREEFENLLPQVLPRFRRIAARWLDSHDEAEDAVQDAMLSAFTHIAQFDGRAKMSTWLTAIVINAVRMRMRRRGRGRMLSLDYSAKEGQLAISELLADPSPTPEKILERFELYGLAIKLSRGLAPAQRAALYLRHQKDFSLKKAAKKLQIPEGTLKARLARGRAKLRTRFQEVLSKPKAGSLSRGRGVCQSLRTAP